MVSISVNKGQYVWDSPNNQKWYTSFFVTNFGKSFPITNNEENIVSSQNCTRVFEIALH